MAVSTARAVALERGNKRHRNTPIYGYLFVLPYVILLLAFGIAPSLYAVYISFMDSNSDTPTFNGLANYIAAFHDFRFGPAFLNIFLFLLIWLPVTIIGVLVLALLLHARLGRFSDAMRLIYYLPGAVAGAASAILWLFMFDPQISPFSLILHAFGFKTIADTLYTPHVPTLLTIIAFSIGAGGWIVVMYGALQNVSSEIMEAAKIDGCNPFQMALQIKLPLIRKYIVYMLILSFAGGTQLFVEPQLLGKASGNLISPTWSPNLLSYNFAFTLGNFGTSAAVSMVLLLIGLAGALLIVFKTDFFSADLIKE